MVKKCVTLGLIILLLVTWTGVAFSGQGIRNRHVCQVLVLPEKGHPWEEDQNKPAQLSSPCPNLENYIGSSSTISTITELILMLCVKYNFENALNARNSTPKR